MKTRTEINIEFDEVIAVQSNSGTRARVWCNSCRGAAIMVTPEVAAAIARVTVRTINRWVEAGEVHFHETPDGLLLLCVSSLAQQSAPVITPHASLGAGEKELEPDDDSGPESTTDYSKKERS